MNLRIKSIDLLLLLDFSIRVFILDPAADQIEYNLFDLFLLKFLSLQLS